MSQGNDWIMSREYALVDPYTLVFYGWGCAQVKRPKVRKSVESEENVPSLFSHPPAGDAKLNHWGASSLPNGKSKDLRLGRPLFPKRGNPRNQLF